MWLNDRATTMQHITIPNAILLRLSRRLTSIFSESDLALDGDVQYLFRALVAGAKLATMEDEEEDMLTPTTSSPFSMPWDSSSTAVHNSEASSPQTVHGDLPMNLNLGNNLPPSSPPLPPSDFDVPSSDLDEGEDEIYEDMTAGPRGVKRTRSTMDTGSELDAGNDVLDNRALRAARRDAARDKDQARVAAIQVMGHNWTPDCNRAGDRVPRAAEVVAREMHNGIPMVQGPDGPEPDPSVSEENMYVPGVGRGSGSGEIRGGVDDDTYVPEEIEDKGNGKGRKRAKGAQDKADWQKVVRKTRLKIDAAPLMSLLTDISTTGREANLWANVDILCHGTQPPPLSTSASAISQILHDMEGIKHDTFILDVCSMLKIMQLALLVDLYVF